MNDKTKEQQQEIDAAELVRNIAGEVNTDDDAKRCKYIIARLSLMVVMLKSQVK